MTLVIDRSHAEDHEAGFALKPQLVSDKIIKNWQDGLSWFRKTNAKAYMVLLD